MLAAVHELVQSEGDFVGMGSAPGNQALQLDGVICDGADFDQFRINDFGVPHSH